MVDKLEKMGHDVWLSKHNRKNFDKFKFSARNMLSIAFCKTTCCAIHCGSSETSSSLVETGVQKFMPTNPQPSKPWKRLGAVSLKSSFSYAKPSLKFLSKERKCPSKAEEDIYLMCCSIHYSHMSTLWLNQDFSLFSKKNLFYLKFKFSALVGTPYTYTDRNCIFNYKI